MADKIKWGISGLGEVANRFAHDLTQHTSNAELIQVASQNIDTALTFANKFNCSNASSYQELAQNNTIEAVYISNINSLHFETALLFLEHNKHVLIEKPAVTEPKEWEKLCSVAKEKNLVLMEAIKFIHFPAFKKLLKFLLQNKDLQINTIKAAFGTQQTFDPSLVQPIFSKELQGGATNDVGVYPLWLYAFFNYFHNKSGRLFSLNTYAPQKSDVDETCDYTMEGEIMGFLEASISEELDKTAFMKGNQFEITIHEKWWNPHKITIEYDNKSILIEEESIGGGFQYEAEHFGNLVLNNKTESNLCPHAVSSQVIEWIAQIHS